MAGRLTLEDIARHAGVSKATVSRVLGRHPERYDVEAATRSKVVRAAESLGWQGVAARKARPEMVVAMIYEATSGSPGDGIAGPLVEAARAAGVVLTFEPVTKPVTAWRQRVKHHLSPIAGLVVTPIPMDPEALTDLPFPLVVVNHLSSLKFPHVVPDDVAAGELLGKRLVAFGHRRAWYLGPTFESHHSVGERAQGLQRAGLQLEILDGNAADEIAKHSRLKTPGRPTAIIGYSWFPSVEALFACLRHGVQVPKDVSVVCFDDHHVAAASHPPLTVVDPQHNLVAIEAIRLLLAGERAPLVHRTPVALVERLSDGPAPVC